MHTYTDIFAFKTATHLYNKTKNNFLKIKNKPGVVAHTFNPALGVREGRQIQPISVYLRKP